MPTFTVQNIVDRAAAISDMHDTFVTPAQWLAWFNVERRALELFKARHAGVAMGNVTTVSTGVGVDRYPLATSGVNETMAIVGVWQVMNTGRLRPLRIVPWVDNFVQDEGGPDVGPAQYVTIEDNNTDGVEVNTLFRFYPRDPNGNYLIMYLKAPVAVTSLITTFSQPLGLEERIVLGMAKRALIKEESDTSAIDELIKKMDQQVEEYCWQRSFAQTPTVRNVDRVQRGWVDMDNFTPPSPESWFWL